MFKALTPPIPLTGSTVTITASAAQKNDDGAAIMVAAADLATRMAMMVVEDPSMSVKPRNLVFFKVRAPALERYFYPERTYCNARAISCEDSGRNSLGS